MNKHRITKLLILVSLLASGCIHKEPSLTKEGNLKVEMNEEKEEFGEKRLVEILMNQDKSGSYQLRQKICDAVSNFVLDAPKHDDMTMVTMRIL